MRYILLFFLFALSAHADLKDPYVLAATEGDPSLNLCPYVNSLTGDFMIDEADLVIEAAEPLVLRRAYVSGDGNGGWSFFPHTTLYVSDSRKQKKKYIHVAEPSGSTIIYKSSADDTHTYRLAIEKQGKGATNTSQGIIGGRTNLKNTVIHRDDDKITMYCANGTKRVYKKSKRKVYLLESEKKANGNYILYKYDDQDRLRKISTMDPSKTNVYAYLKISYPSSHGQSFDITTSDGRNLSYEMSHGYLFVNNSSHKPKEKLSYKAATESGFLVKERSFPDGRKIQIDYYKKKDADIHSHEDPRCDRVKTIYEMVGEELVPTYRFSYDVQREKNKKGKKHFTYKENGTTEIYDALDNLTKVHFTPHFYVTDIERFQKTHQEQVFHSKICFEWEPDGQLKAKSLVDENHNKVWERTLKYDTNGNVLLETFSGNLSGSGNWESYQKKYTYDENNLMRSQEEDNGKKIIYGHLPGTDLLTVYLIFDKSKILKREFRRYNSSNLLEILITDDGITDDPDNLSEVTERFITKFKYEPRGLPEFIQEYYLNDEKEIPIKTTYIGYNKKGKIKKKDIYDNENKLRYTLHYDYNDYGYLTYETNPLGEETIASYDAFGNQMTLMPPGGPLQMRDYDKGNNLKYSAEVTEEEKQITYYHYNNKRQQIDSLDYLNRETRFEHDLDGNVISIISPIVLDETGKEITPITTNTYNCLGKQTSITTPKGHTTKTTYNSRGSPTLITHPDGSKEQYIYNLDGTLKTSIDAEGYTTDYTWDIFERPLTKEVAGIAKEIFSYNTFHLLQHTNPEGHTTTYTYNKAGQKTSETLDKTTTLYSYDPLGRLLRTQQEDLLLFTEYNLLDQLIEERAEDISCHLLSKTTYKYHPSGNHTQIIRHHDDGISVEITDYDLFNRIKEKKDPLGHITSYAYKKNLLQRTLELTETNPLGNTTITTIDPLDRISSIEKKNRHGETTALDTLFYDADSHLAYQKTLLIPGHGTLHTRWDYDNRGQLAKLIQAEGTQEEKTTHYSYTLRGARKTITKPDGTILSYTYDPLNRLEELTSSTGDIHYLYHYNTQASQPTSIDDLIAKTTTTLSYNTSGQVLQETLANGLTLTNTYDTRSRRKSLTLPDHSFILYDYTANNLYSVSKYTPANDLIYTHTYTHYDISGPLRTQELINNLGTIHYTIDALARTTAITAFYFTQTLDEIDPCGNITLIHTNQEPFTFSYNSLNQLTQEKKHTYKVDSLHRRLEKDSTPNHPNSLNQLHLLYTYDQNGNPRINHEDNTTYTYDSLDRLIEITKQDGTALSYTYDPLHRRLSKTLHQNNTSSTLLFLYDGQNEIGAATQNGTLTELRILGNTPHAEISAAIAIELNNIPYAPLHDLFGNLTHLIDPTGTIIAYQEYTAFGETTPSISPWGFSSKRTDSETHLVYFGRRYYVPATGRWLTSDPAGLTDGPNLYAYLHHSPLTAHDLYGLFAIAPGTGNILATGRRQVEQESNKLQQFMSGTNASTKNYHIYRPPAYPPNTQNLPLGMIIHNNGMDTDLNTHLSNLKYISDLGGEVPVHGVHFATHGKSTDLKIAFATRKSGMNNTIMEIVNKCHEAYQIVGPNGGILLFNHSLGCLHAYFGIWFLPPEIRSIMYVINVAPAKFLHRNSGVKDIMSYGSTGDFVHRWDSKGLKMAIEEGSFTLLKSVKETGYPDHGIQSATFKEPTRQLTYDFAKTFYCQ